MVSGVVLATLFFLVNFITLAAGKGDLEKVTSRVYFDIEIAGKASGRYIYIYYYFHFK